jgi:tetratricopeptide (TPR) repeat protein
VARPASGADHDRIRAAYEAGDFRHSHAQALEALQATPDDAELLSLAGRSAVELGSDDAVDLLRRVVELAPDAEAWRDLGDALATEGRTSEADEAFRKVLELEPDDELALTNVGHIAYTSGDRDDAVSLLAQAAEGTPRASTAAINLVEMHRILGHPEEALAAARRVAEADPDDVISALDIAELSLELDKLDDAAQAFARVRELDDVPGHEIYPVHGLIQVAMRRGDIETALTLAGEASALDQHGRSGEIAAFLAAQLPDAEVDAAASDQPLPGDAEVAAALAASLADYRRLLAQGRNLPLEAGG